MTGRLTLQDIRRVWAQIKPSIVELHDKWAFEWKPEDVYAQCLMGRAFCYTCADGFIVVQPRENPYSLATELFVWLCVSTASNGLLEYNDDIRLIAKDINATSIIFGSPREGFRKIAKQNGWQSMTEYKFPVN